MLVYVALTSLEAKVAEELREPKVLAMALFSFSVPKSMSA